MDALSLTSFNQIRGVLTVSDTDLDDGTLEAYGLGDDLAEDLDTWLPGWEGVQEVKQLRLLRLYAKYFCAATVAATAPVFILTKDTDGENEGQRSDTASYRWLAAELRTRAAGYRDKILGGYTAESEELAVVSRVTPTRDPVTEARDETA